MTNGAEVTQVGELKFALDEGFIGSEGFTVLVFEVEAYRGRQSSPLDN